MFGLFKKLFSKPASPPPTAAPMLDKPGRPPAPAPMTSAPQAPASASTPRLAPKLTDDIIELPLSEILSRLPNDLAALVYARPEVMFSVSASVALEQLRTGAVRIPFAQLRRGSPPGTFADNSAHGDSLIELPLPLILAAIGPAGLVRRPDQKRTTVPDEVTGVFGANNGHLNGSAPCVSAPAAPPLPVEPPIPAPATPKPIAFVPPKPVAPALPKLVTPVVLPSPALEPATSQAPRPAMLKTPASVPIPFAAPKPSSPLPFATARPSPPPPAAAPVSNGEKVVMALQAVCGAWPEPVRREIEQLNLGSASISIPLNRLEPGMKTGRVAFNWAELCAWLTPPVAPSANGGSQVELPLKVIAPLFLAKHRAAAPRKVVTLGESLPDLFAGRIRPPLPPATPVIAPATPAPVAAPIAPGENLEPPLKTAGTPQDIVQKILLLPGIVGAVLASNDGLLVAGQMPTPMKAETMAAFLPRIFTHAGQCAGEIQLGTLRSLKLSAGLAPCIICKAGTLYLAVLGRAGETLPETALEQMASDLARQNH